MKEKYSEYKKEYHYIKDNSFTIYKSPYGNGKKAIIVAHGLVKTENENNKNFPPIKNNSNTKPSMLVPPNTLLSSKYSMSDFIKMKPYEELNQGDKMELSLLSNFHEEEEHKNELQNELKNIIERRDNEAKKRDEYTKEFIKKLDKIVEGNIQEETIEILSKYSYYKKNQEADEIDVITLEPDPNKNKEKKIFILPKMITYLNKLGYEKIILTCCRIQDKTNDEFTKIKLEEEKELIQLKKIFIWRMA